MQAAAALVGLALAATGCASGLHLEPAAARAPALFRDADLEAAVGLVTSVDQVGTALSLALRNRGSALIELRTGELALVGADHQLIALGAGEAVALAPGQHWQARLPAPPEPALALHAGDRIELVVPTVVRGVLRDYHFRLRVRRGRGR